MSNRITDKKHRYASLRAREEQLLNSGCSLVAGVDEAGRGPLAGPVVAAAACRSSEFPAPAGPYAWLLDVFDSKSVSESKRETLFDRITADDSPFQVGIGIVDSREIDAGNILKATHQAMRTAVRCLVFLPECVLVDGTAIPGLTITHEKIIKGDRKCLCIAAASIVAKVTRDRLMRTYAERYPLYGFDKHKGYGTAKHITSIRNHGRCPIHRQSFKVAGLDPEKNR